MKQKIKNAITSRLSRARVESAIGDKVDQLIERHRDLFTEVRSCDEVDWDRVDIYYYALIQIRDIAESLDLPNIFNRINREFRGLFLCADLCYDERHASPQSMTHDLFRMIAEINSGMTITQTSEITKRQPNTETA